MARPPKLTLDFFMHDANASGDRKIRGLSRRHGNDGYATYFRLLEAICREDGMKLSIKNDLDAETIAEDCHLRDTAHLYQIIETCVSLELFNAQLWKSERIVFSDGLYRRYLRRLEDRKADANRKKQKYEAKCLQQKISEVESTIFSEVIHPENNDFRSDNREIQNQIQKQNQRSDSHTQDLACESECLSIKTEMTSVKVEPESTSVGQAEGQRLNVDSAAAPQKRFVSGCEKVEARFNGKNFPWKTGNGPNAINRDFAQFVLKHSLCKTSMGKEGKLDITHGQRWINAADYDPRRESDCWLEWEAYQLSQQQSGAVTTEVDDEWEAIAIKTGYIARVERAQGQEPRIISTTGHFRDYARFKAANSIQKMLANPLKVAS